MGHEATEPDVVLVVEDNPLILLDAADFLTQAGYTVVKAVRADEALQIVKRGLRPVALFTDVETPGLLDGFELAELIKSKLPHIAVIIASGHRTPAESHMPEGAYYFRKPYSPSDIIKILENLKKQ